MTQKVSDEVLGKFARRQNDWFRRVREGSLDAEDVNRVVRELTRPVADKLEVRTLITSVNYTESLTSLVVPANFSWCDPSLVNIVGDARDCHKGNSQREVAIDIVCLKQRMKSSECVIKELRCNGYRPATAIELITLALNERDLSRETPAVSALGTRWLKQVANRGVEYTCSVVFQLREVWEGSWCEVVVTRSIQLNTVEGVWPGDTRFAAVRIDYEAA